MAGKLFSELNSVSRIGTVLLFILCTCEASFGEGPLQDGTHLSGIHVQVQDAYGGEAQWIEMVDCLASSIVQEGDLLSADKIQRLATALKACRRFEHIHLDTEMTENGLKLIITVTPFKLIKDIRFHGKYPLFEKQILNVMTLYPGDAFDEAEVDRQPKLIAQLYRRYGYIDPKVTIQRVQEGDDGHYVLQVMIEKGRQYRLGQLTIQGNKAFSTEKIRWKMKSIRYDQQAFSPKQFSEDLDKLKSFYLAKGFSNVVISHQVKQNSESGTVDVQLQLAEGDRYQISFEGNTFFWDMTLKKDLVFFKPSQRGGSSLRKSIRNIQERYRNAGFIQVAIQTDTRVSQEGDITVRSIRLMINEGPRSIVQKIVFSGNTVFNREILSRYVLTRTPGWLHDGEYVQQRLEEDILSIENLYHNNGYLNAAVEKKVMFSSNKTFVDIQLDINEGEQTTVAAVTVKGLTAFSEEALLTSIRTKTGGPFSAGEVKNDEKKIAILISEKGYPFVQVASRTTFSDDRTKAEVVFEVNQNSYTERGRTFYAGNFRTKEKILDRELVMKAGDPFSLQKMLQGQQNIRSMDIFRSVAFHPVGLKEQLDTIHMFTELEEEKPFYFEATGGYASEKGLFATSTLGDHNFFGLNKDFKVGGEVSETGYRGESRIFEPRFLSTRISSDLGAFFERSKPFNQTFGTDRIGTNLVFARKWKKRIKGELGFRYERRKNFARDSQTETDDLYDPRSVLVMSPALSYDSRDNFMNPKSGLFMLLGTDVSRGIENSLDNYIQYNSDLRGYVTPLERLTLAARGSFGRIEPYGSKGTVPQDQLFFLGGTTSIRGFDENLFLTDAGGDPVGGRIKAVGNAEVRIDLGWNVELSFFYDIGYLEQTSAPHRAENVRYSTGAGLRYVTPVGAVGLVYGHKLNPEPDESPGRVHFSIGYTF